MNPIEQLIKENLQEGETVVCVFADRASVGILIRHADGTESSHEMQGGNYVLNQKWVAEAIWLRNRSLL